MKTWAFTRAQEGHLGIPTPHQCEGSHQRSSSRASPHLWPLEDRMAKDTQASGVTSALSLRKHLFS